MTSFRKLTPEDELLELKETFGSQTQSSYMMNLDEIDKDESASINLYFDKLNMNVEMV